MIDIEKLEQVLVKNWTHFISARELLSLMRETVKNHCDVEPCTVSKVSVSRFELTDKGFIVWIEFAANSIAGTSEFYLSQNGLKHVRTIAF